MDYTECLKAHGYIADKSDTENSNVEEIYNKYKPPPVPYDEFKHQVVTIYADSGTTSQSNNTSNSSSSNTFLKTTHTANPSGTVQRNRSRRPVSNVNSMLQQQLDQFTNSYQQRTDTPIRDILTRPDTVRERAPPRARAKVRAPSPPWVPVAMAEPARRVYTLTPPPPPAAANIPVHHTRTAAVHSEPPPAAAAESPRSDLQVPYQPLVTPEGATSQPARRPRRAQRQQQQEEEESNCCCCIC